MKTPYPSDINREQFELIRTLLESACRKTATGMGLPADTVPAGRTAHQAPHEGS